jgi:hypothetical protein
MQRECVYHPSHGMIISIRGRTVSPSEYAKERHHVSLETRSRHDKIKYSSPNRFRSTPGASTDTLEVVVKRLAAEGSFVLYRG